jgi:hypothetical protein
MDDARIDDAGVEEIVGRLDALLERVESMPGEDGEAARDAVSSLALTYGEALARALAAAGPVAVERLSRDPLVGHLMVLHGLQPPAPPRTTTTFVPVESLRRKVPG